MRLVSVQVGRRPLVYMEDEGCSCFINPPCSFCLSLTEEEAEVFYESGHEAVWGMRRELDEFVP